MGDIWPLTFEDSSSNCRKAVRRALMTKWNVLVAIFGSMSGIILLSSFLDLLNTNLSIFDGEFWSENFFHIVLSYTDSGFSFSDTPFVFSLPTGGCRF